MREEIAADPQRPRYHLIPPANWINDPNGPIYWKNKYHLFYQYNPYAPVDGPKHWGHAVSRDLVHWSHLPIALSPSPNGPDKDGCWSGCAVNSDGVPTIVYTGVHPEVQCIATSDDMIIWEKYNGNPVVSSPPNSMEATGFRDPCVWRENNNWYMIIGSGIKGIGGAALLYKSRDLINWEYMHPLCVGDKKETGMMWECPDFFPLGNKYVLLVSTLGTTLYFIGNYIDYKFYPEFQGSLDFGGHYYAARSMIDGLGRRILFGWVTEARSTEAQLVSGWAGIQSLPRVLSLREDNILSIEPVPELKSLRCEKYEYGDIRVKPTSYLLFEDIQGDCIEIEAEIDPCDAEKFGFKVRCACNNVEETLIFYNCKRRALSIDTTRSSLYPDVSRELREAPLVLTKDENLKLHIFLDRSVIEAFANNHVCLTSRIYPSRSNSLGIGLFSHGGSAIFKSVNIWEIKSIWQ
jgi:beta-fructofuranosidase